MPVVSHCHVSLAIHGREPHLARRGQRLAMLEFRYSSNSHVACRV